MSYLSLHQRVSQISELEHLHFALSKRLKCRPFPLKKTSLFSAPVGNKCGTLLSTQVSERNSLIAKRPVFFFQANNNIALALWARLATVWRESGSAVSRQYISSMME